MEPKLITAGVIIEDDKGQILVIHRKSNVPEGNTWGLVGGKVNPEDIIRDLISKVNQEIGLDLNKCNLRKIKVFEWNVDKKIVFHLYKVIVKKNPNINLNREGHSEYMWKKPKELYDNFNLMTGLYRIIEEIYS